ncbi:hypothetical protein [Streptomyces sp. NPDC051014]|uniref:hypothetical protein n=1 Tax=Streptomyces sp. NPDC051014 TaxID=3155751 RepID=UPI0033E7A807
MVIEMAQGPYGLLLANGLISPAEPPAVRMVMLPMWLFGIGFAVWRGRCAVLVIWADRQLVRVLGGLNALPRVTALQRRRGCVALMSLKKALEQMKADHGTDDEWSELRSRVRALVTNFIGGSQTSKATSATA